MTEPTELSALVEADRQKRIAACSKEIEAVLAKYECTLDASVLLKNNQVLSQIAIVSKW